MAYKSMYDVFYTQSAEYDRIYKERISSDKCIKFDFKIGKYDAFYMKCDEIYELIIRILRLDKNLQEFIAQDVILSKSISLIANSFLIDEVKLTNEIEGIHSTRKEIRSLVISSKSEEKKRRLQGIVDKYKMLLEGKDIPLVTCSDVRALYDDIVLPELIADEIPDGKIFRKDIVKVFSKTGKVLHQGVYPEKKIIELMEKALEILNDREQESLVNIAIFHYLFGYIHPFYDGNGRMGRFITSAFLAKELHKMVSVSISYTIKNNLSLYYDMFKKANHINNRGDMTCFIIEFLRLILEDLSNIFSFFDKKYDELFFYIEKVDKVLQLKKNEYYIYISLLMAAIFNEEGINILELAHFLNIGEPKIGERTIRNIVNNLPKDYVIKEKIGKTYYYMANLEALDKVK